MKLFEGSDYEIIDSNGQKYAVGYDKHGWFSVVAVEATADGWRIPDWESVASFSPENAERIAEIINEG